MSNLPQTKKSLGQHWLTDHASLEAMCDAAGVQRGDCVLEIGPGTGELTAELLQRGAKVKALELDESLLAGLRKRFSAYAADELEILQGDIRTFNLTTLPADYKIVANIPYYLTAHLLRILSETPNKPARAALLVQKEVAERVAAEPGDMSIVSVTSQLNYTVSKGWLVPAALFTPPPKVDSQVLILERHTNPLFEDIDERVLYRVVKAGFSTRRKTLLNALSGGLRISKAETQHLLDVASIDSQLRAQTLSLDQWYRLSVAAMALLSPAK